MKVSLTLIALVSALILTGCKSRPISNSGYDNNWSYKGELSELSVLGVAGSKNISEADIQEAATTRGSIRINRSDKIVLVQSGTQFPDDSLMKEAEKYYRVIPLSGIPSRNNNGYDWQRSKNKEEIPKLDMAFRLTAAKAGAETLIVYWGVLESAREGYATKTISWVPIVGSLLPDEEQQMRIRLKAAIIDVKTSYWEMLIPEVYEDEIQSAGINRKQKDQKQVALLKERGYKRLIADIQTRFEG